MNLGKMLFAKLGALMAGMDAKELRKHADAIGHSRRSHKHAECVGSFRAAGVGGPSRKCRRLRAKLGIE